MIGSLNVLANFLLLTQKERMRWLSFKNLKCLWNLKSQGAQMSPMPQAPFVEGDITNAELRAALWNLKDLMTSQSHGVYNHFVSKANQVIPASRIRDFIRCMGISIMYYLGDSQDNFGLGNSYKNDFTSSLQYFQS